MKLTVIVLGAALLFLLLIRAVVEITVPRAEGEYLSLQEAGNMTWLLADTAGITDSNAYASIFRPGGVFGQRRDADLFPVEADY